MTEAAPVLPARPSRKRFWLLVISVALALPVFASLLAWCVLSARARRRWEEFKPRHAATKERLERTIASRPPLWGDPLPGQRWPSYVKALQEAELMSQGEGDDLSWELSVTTARGISDPAAALLAARAPILQSLRTGMRFADSGRDGLGPGLDPPGLPSDQAFRTAGYLLVLSSRQRLKSGDTDGAIEDLAAELQLGADVASAGNFYHWMLGGGLQEGATLEASAIATWPSLSSAQASRLLQVLDRAADDFPPLDCCIDSQRLAAGNELAALALGIAGPDDTGFQDMKLLQRARILRWRHGFAWRTAAADVDDVFEEISKAVARFESRPWPEAQAAYAALEKIHDGDVLLDLLVMPWPEAHAGVGRERLARNRVLIAILRERIGQAVAGPGPVDPFTLQPLHRAESQGVVRIWSEAYDGDNGGAGDWMSGPQPGEDIGLEWKK